MNAMPRLLLPGKAELLSYHDKETRMNRITRRRITNTLLASLLAASAVLPAQAQERPAKILLGFPAGGSFDTIARLLADKLKGELNRPIIVENKPGAGGRLAVDSFKNAPADGSVVMFAPGAVTSLYQFTVAKLNYDPVKDLTPIGTVAEFPFVIAVNPKSNIGSLSELVASVKKNTTSSLFGTPALAAPPHFYGTNFGDAIGVKFEPVPFQGSAPLNMALIGGQISMAVDVMGGSLENHRAGKIRILAVSTAQRAPQLPDVPTFAESGFASITGGDFNALFAPANTPAATVAAWSNALTKVMALPEVKEKLIMMGFIPVGKSPEELASRAASSAKLWEKAVKAAGFVAE
jgi:tripartite-type tricarboxylate transporter receptor subunit TctC